MDGARPNFGVGSVGLDAFKDVVQLGGSEQWEGGGPVGFEVGGAGAGTLLGVGHCNGRAGMSRRGSDPARRGDDDDGLPTGLTSRSAAARRRPSYSPSALPPFESWATTEPTVRLVPPPSGPPSRERRPPLASTDASPGSAAVLRRPPPASPLLPPRAPAPPSPISISIPIPPVRTCQQSVCENVCTSVRALVCSRARASPSLSRPLSLPPFTHARTHTHAVCARVWRFCFFFRKGGARQGRRLSHLGRP